VADLAREIRAKSKTVHIHSDAVQGLGKIDMRWLASSSCDSAAFSAHKIGAFKGSGALWLKPGVKLATWMTGGGQERSKRAGTENLPGIVSFGLACKEIGKELSLDATWFEKPRERQVLFLKGLAEIPGAVVHSDPATGVANTVNFHVEGVAGDDILLNLDLEGFAASSGSACSSGVGRPSHVLKAMGWNDDIALGSVRISFGTRGCTGDVDRLITVLKGVVKRLQSSGAGKVRGSPP
jgi:cysteine desulfurase